MTRKVCLLQIGDGREDYHRRARVSLAERLPPVDYVVEVDDSSHELGFTGAVIEGWRRVLETDADYVFHAELDFTYDEPVELDRMIGVLERRSYLVQLSLLRQPVNEAESAAGGIVQMSPDDYVEVRDGEDVWLEQRRFFTTNPSVYRTELCRRGWPNVKHSEGIFTAHVRDPDPDVRFGIWGAKWDPPRVTHIGDQRAGHGY